MSLSAEEMRELFEETEVIRRPRYGIVRGYHELPYICFGQALDAPYETMRVKGSIQVSPRFVIRPSHLLPRYRDIFGEDNVDAELAGRMFGFVGFRDRPVECVSENLEVENFASPVQEVIQRELDHLDRYEDITTGVLYTPNSRYYPVSIERFIATILEDEFSV
jgi:hypothetical protein